MRIFLTKFVAQLLYIWIDVTDSLPASLTHVLFSFVDHISVVLDRFGSSLRFCHLVFDKEAISDRRRVNMADIGGVLEFSVILESSS